MGVSVSSSVWAATAPRQQMYSGWISGQLAVQESAAIGDFVGQGRAIARRAAFEHVEDVHVAARERAGLDDLGQQLSGPAHERLALPVFVGAGRLAQKAQPRLGIAHAEHRLSARGCQFVARAAGSHLLANHFERIAGNRRRLGRQTRAGQLVLEQCCGRSLASSVSEVRGGPAWATVSTPARSKLSSFWIAAVLDRGPRSLTLSCHPKDLPIRVQSPLPLETVAEVS